MDFGKFDEFFLEVLIFDWFFVCCFLVIVLLVKNLVVGEGFVEVLVVGNYFDLIGVLQCVQFFEQVVQFYVVVGGVFFVVVEYQFVFVVVQDGGLVVVFFGGVVGIIVVEFDYLFVDWYFGLNVGVNWQQVM